MYYDAGFPGLAESISARVVKKCKNLMDLLAMGFGPAGFFVYFVWVRGFFLGFEAGTTNHTNQHETVLSYAIK